jgi:hypothetical protein
MPKEERKTRENEEDRKKYDEKERIQTEIMKGTKDGGMEKGRDL